MQSVEEIEQRISSARRSFDELRAEMARVIVGHESLIEQVFIALVCGGHCLLEGVPGLGKTLMVRSLGEVLSLSFSRIQFTPDLMPADITGGCTFHPRCAYHWRRAGNSQARAPLEKRGEANDWTASRPSRGIIRC